jgi:hypothetical protein
MATERLVYGLVSRSSRTRVPTEACPANPGSARHYQTPRCCDQTPRCCVGSGPNKLPRPPAGPPPMIRQSQAGFAFMRFDGKRKAGTLPSSIDTRRDQERLKLRLREGRPLRYALSRRFHHPTDLGRYIACRRRPKRPSSVQCLHYRPAG